MKIQPHTQYPLVHLAAALAAGIAASHYLPSRTWFIAGCCASCLILSVSALRKLNLVLLLFAFLLTGLALGLQSHHQSKSPLRHWLSTQTSSVVLTGMLERPPEIARDRIYFLLKVDSISSEAVAGRVSLLLPINSPESKTRYDSLNLRYGTRIRARARLTLLDQYRNPGVSSLSDYLDQAGLDSLGIIKNVSAIERLDDVKVFPPLALLYGWRTSLQEKIDATFSPETAGVLDAALLGNRHNLPGPIADRFRTGGTFHVLVISGFHISFLGGLAFFFASRLTQSRLSRFFLSSLVVWSYSIAVGAEASVVRAALMFSFVTFASVLFRQGTALNALGAGVITALTLDPKLLFDPSFQLTFLSVWAIVAIALPLLRTLANIGRWTPARDSPYPPNCSSFLRSFCETLYWREAKWKVELSRSAHTYKLFKCRIAARLEKLHLQALLRYLFVTVLVTVAVQIVLLPLLIIYFHRLSPASLILNLVVSLLLAAVAALALFALIVAQLSVALAEPLVRLTELTNLLMVHSVDPFVHLGIASLRLPEYTGWKFAIYLLYYLPLLHLVAVIRRWDPLTLIRARQPYVAAPLQLVLLVLILNPIAAGRGDGRLHVDFLDVGQGDSSLLTMPDGTTLLIDAGGLPPFFNTRERRRIGETVVSEYLWWLGLNRVDYLLATHADADHIDGLNDVLKNFTVRSVLVAQTPETDSEFAKLKTTAESTGTKIETIRAGDTLVFGPVVAQVVWPPTSQGQSSNNESLVLRFQFNARTLLFTGDIEKESEQAILRSGVEVKSDVVKVPHHGSRTSSTESFVRNTAPKLAIISVGRASMFGHPHHEVVNRWRAAGAEVLTTGECGLIRVSTDGHELTVKKYIP
jgi:competence protein ComEC